MEGKVCVTIFYPVEHIGICDYLPKLRVVHLRVSAHDDHYQSCPYVFPQTFRHRIVGFEERSFIRRNNGKYIYTNYERRRFFSVKTEKSRSSNHLPPGYKIEIKDGTRILHVKNKTFILGKSSSNNLKGSTIMRQSEYSSANESQKSEGYNIMLNSCFLHRVYLEMYFNPVVVPANLLEYVNEERNCEDILMSVVVTKFLNDVHRPQCGVLAVKASWIDNLEEEARKFNLF